MLHRLDMSREFMCILQKLMLETIFGVDVDATSVTLLLQENNEGPYKPRTCTTLNQVVEETFD